MTTKRPPTKQERVHAVLRERILDGTYGPGFRVVIDALAEEFGVSALPVREAIRRLEAEGLVIYRANAGAQVAPIDPTLIEEEMTVLAVLEGYATAIAAPELNREDLDHLTGINSEMADAMNAMDPVRFGALNRDFHTVIYDRCANPALVELLQEVSDRLALMRRTVFVQIPYRGKDSVREHRDIIKLLRQKAPAAEIEAAARAHKLHTVESFRRWREAHEA